MRMHTPSFRHHKPTGQAVVTIDGRDIYLGRFDTPQSRAEYDRLIGEWLANGRTLPPERGGPADLTINELILAYWKHVQSYYVKHGRPTSEQDTVKQALRFLRPPSPYGDTPAKEFGPLALKAVRKAMIEHGWCRGYINKQVNRLRRMFSWAAENELLPLSVYQELANVAGLRRNRTAAREKGPVMPVSDGVVAQTLPRLSPTVAAMVQVQRLCGCRPQEIVLMRAVDIDMTDPQCWVYRPDRHKLEHHDRERIIYIGPRAQAILRPFLTLDVSGYLFSPKRAEEERRAALREARKTPFTPSQRARRPKPLPKRQPGDQYNVGSYRKAIRAACVKLGIPIWFPNQLRHAAASEIRRRYGLDASQAVLGHSELDTTQIYATACLERARAVMFEVG
jgi:integrase